MNKKSIVINLYVSMIIAVCLRPLFKDNINYLAACALAGLLYAMIKKDVKK